VSPGRADRWLDSAATAWVEHRADYRAFGWVNVLRDRNRGGAERDVIAEQAGRDHRCAVCGDEVDLDSRVAPRVRPRAPRVDRPGALLVGSW